MHNCHPRAHVKLMRTLLLWKKSCNVVFSNHTSSGFCLYTWAMASLQNAHGQAGKKVNIGPCEVWTSTITTVPQSLIFMYFSLILAQEENTWGTPWVGWTCGAANIPAIFTWMAVLKQSWSVTPGTLRSMLLIQIIHHQYINSVGFSDLYRTRIGINSKHKSIAGLKMIEKCTLRVMQPQACTF